MAFSQLHPKDSASRERITRTLNKSWRLTLAVLVLPFLVLIFLLTLHSKVSDQARQQSLHEYAGHRVDLNHATAAELSLLPGIGEKLGHRIVQERQKGLFINLDDLENRVDGIGARVSAKLKEHVTIQSYPVHGLEKDEYLEQNQGTEIANAEHEDEDR